MQKRLAFALRVAMGAKGWTAPDLARALKKHPSTVNRWVNGTSVPDLFMVDPLAEALGVPPDYIYKPAEVPEYPISLENLVRKVTIEGMEEGIAKARSPRRRAAGGRSSG